MGAESIFLRFASKRPMQLIATTKRRDRLIGVHYKRSSQHSFDFGFSTTELRSNVLFRDMIVAASISVRHVVLWTLELSLITSFVQIAHLIQFPDFLGENFFSLLSLVSPFLVQNL
jgi:hypothetical protein